MATERLSMRNTREILRLKWQAGRTHREVARSLGVSAGAVGGVVGRATEAKLDWAQVQALSDEALEERLYGLRAPSNPERPYPDCVYLHVELRRPGVTLALLHLEYLEKNPGSPKGGVGARERGTGC